MLEKAGKENTEVIMTLAKENAELLGVSSIIIASTWGGNAREALKVFDPKSVNLVVVTHNANFTPGTPQEFDEKLRKEIIEKGGKVITGTLAFSGVQSALNKQYNAFDLSGLYARLLRDNFGDGVKVCIECVLMACDAGVIQPEEKVLAIAGSGTGADTLCLIKAQTSRLFGKLKVMAILAKPM